MKKGSRKLIAGAWASVVLSGGYVLAALVPTAQGSFPAFATAVVSILTAVCIGNAAEHFAASKKEAVQ